MRGLQLGAGATEKAEYLRPAVGGSESCLAKSYEKGFEYNVEIDGGLNQRGVGKCNA